MISAASIHYGAKAASVVALVSVGALMVRGLWRVFGKIRDVEDHLIAQDDKLNRQSVRLARIERKLGIDAEPVIPAPYKGKAGNG